MGNPAEEPFEIQGYRFPPLGARAYMPVVPREFTGLGSEERYEVVGESRHLEGIHAVVAAWRADGDDGGNLLAMLVAEPLNPFDHNAVRVDLFYSATVSTCGYLPREQARRLQHYVRERADEGLVVAMYASVFGGTPDKPNVGVWLGGEPAER